MKNPDELKHALERVKSYLISAALDKPGNSLENELYIETEQAWVYAHRLDKTHEELEELKRKCADWQDRAERAERNLKELKAKTPEKNSANTPPKEPRK